MGKEKIIGYDLDAYEYITPALMELVNRYPRLDGERVSFSDIATETGMTLVPNQSAVILANKEDITGRVSQKCAYSFFIYYRVSDLSERKKERLKEWLDDLGRWLEMQPIFHDGLQYKLENYPELTGQREIKQITRQTPAYLQTVTENLVETWAISLQVQYTNEYQKGGIE